MKKLIKFTILVIWLIMIGCKENCPCESKLESKEEEYFKPTFQDKLARLNDSMGKDILVVAHRGDWRNAPENSLDAIKNCIDMGVDMVEIDVRKSKDGSLVLMHDETLDRTTTGKGYVVDWTLDSLKTLSLTDGIGAVTKHKIPTLKEALLECKGKILVNLDKSYDYFDEVFNIAKQTGTTNHIVIKGYGKTVDEVISDFGSKLDTIIFMPIINLDEQKNASKIIDNFQTKLNVKAIELVFATDTSQVISEFFKIKKKGSRVWVNSLWGFFNAGHGDEEAVKNQDSIYGWYVDKGINMIQTDRPQLLLDYLREQELNE